ncbi:hypothetical protein BHM03_00026565, partial [Ensete ventricosum]
LLLVENIPLNIDRLCRDPDEAKAHFGTMLNPPLANKLRLEIMLIGFTSRSNLLSWLPVGLLDELAASGWIRIFSPTLVEE